jgi:hypothetical protein
LEIHDLVISKYVANRDKDRRFNRAAAKHGLVNRAVLLDRLTATPVEARVAETIRSAIAADFAA